VTSLVHLTPLDSRYPSRLRGVEGAPASITVKGGSTEASVVVAIVGSRAAADDALTYAGILGFKVARAGAVVVSGGAIGIDGAAHRGALVAGGRTWAVAPSGHEGCFPPEHQDLFAEIGRGPGAMIWPFAPAYRHRTSSFLARNRVLVALADAVVVIQAGSNSGALHAASWARKLRKPLWVVPVAPWTHRFGGSRELLADGARPLTSSHLLLRSLGLSASGNRAQGAVPPGASMTTQQTEPRLSISEHEFRVLGAISTAPRHADAISTSAGMSPQATTAALLTLALENVVVEGPPGFFRRREAHNR
jgi:DNA processing protein